LTAEEVLIFEREESCLSSQINHMPAANTKIATMLNAILDE
jgi:hypothetical protein